MHFLLLTKVVVIYAGVASAIPIPTNTAISEFAKSPLSITHILPRVIPGEREPAQEPPPDHPVQRPDTIPQPKQGPSPQQNPTADEQAQIAKQEKQVEAFRARAYATGDRYMKNTDPSLEPDLIAATLADYAKLRQAEEQLEVLKNTDLDATGGSLGLENMFGRPGPPG